MVVVVLVYNRGLSVSWSPDFSQLRAFSSGYRTAVANPTTNCSGSVQATPAQEDGSPARPPLASSEETPLPALADSKETSTTSISEM